MLSEGDWDTSFTAGDNSAVLPTDTIKNSVLALAAREGIASAEAFGEQVGRHLLWRSPAMRSVRVRLEETVWERLPGADGAPHPHAFLQRQRERWTAEITVPRESAPTFASGVADVCLLKTTGSAFSGFLRDAWTTLPETRDRFFSTMLTSRWEWAKPPAGDRWREANEAILAAMLRVFADEFSESVQATLYAMGTAALGAAPEVARVRLAMPNRHYLPFDPVPYGIEDRREVFVPTDEPHGQIEAEVERV